MITIVYDGRQTVQYSCVFATLSGDFVARRPVQWGIFGQVAVRILGGKIIARGPRAFAMDEELKCAIEA